MPATLDDALQLAGQLKAELLGVDLLQLADDQRPLISDAIDLTATTQSRIEAAIRIDDDLHPEDR